MPGLNESVIRRISLIKGEHEWMTEWRLKAFRAWQEMEEPEWAHVDYPKIDYQSNAWKLVPAGTCASMETPHGTGTLEANDSRLPS